VARAGQQLRRPGQGAAQIGRARGRREIEQAVAQPQLLARQLGRVGRPLRRAHHRDLGLGAELLQDPRRGVDLAIEQRASADAVAAGERVVDHEHHRLRAARHRRAARPARGERLGDRQRQRDAGQEPHHQQQPLAQLQPPRGLALRADQERQRGELHDPGAAPADQVDHQRDRHADQPDQHQRREERHRRSRGPRRAATSASSVSSSGRVVSARW
jgi:hypothetical protein